MILKLSTAFLALLLAACGVFGQTTSAAMDAAINGVWRGEMNGLPVLTLLVTDERGGLTGARLFYFQKRTTEKEPWTAVPRTPEPIFNPPFDGKTFLFEVSHRRAHPPGSLNDPPKHYRLTLIGPSMAEAVNLDEQGPALTLVRSDY